VKQLRTDIQGLRAYAVLAVMLYHFGVPGFSGGFVGVDVFFVISGFLMTAIIVRGIEQEKFSILDFYLARARRIIPALTVVCVALLALGWFWLSPSDYTMLSKHSGSAIGFYSNFIFMDEEGYFDAPSQSKWLLHTWSLSLEWQFYLLYPLLLIAVARCFGGTRRGFRTALLCLFMVSLVASILVTPKASSFAFYQLPTRAWQLLAGGLVFLYAVPLASRIAQHAPLVGLAFIAISAHCLHTLVPWPSAYALLPVMGAALVIAGAQQQHFLTNNAIVQALGRWSYSIYLWHWPIVVALGYFSLKTPIGIAAGFAASVALGALSYALVEQPARRYFTGRTRTALAALAAMLLIAATGAWIHHQQGLPARVSETIQAIDREASNRLPPFKAPCGFKPNSLVLTPCVLGDANNIRWVVWGDSHAGSIVSAVQAATQSGVLYYSHACATLFNTELKSKARNNHCTEFNRKTAEQIATLPRNVGVIVINRYSVNIKGPNEGVNKPWGFVYTDATAPPTIDPHQRYITRFGDTLCSVAKHRAVYAVAPIPEMGREVPQTMVRAAMAGKPLADITIPRTAYDARNDVAFAALNRAKKHCGVRVLYPTPYLCDKQFCHGAKDGKPLYFDDDHLSESGNKVLLPMFRELKR
jgi:peptidoglycan/LPS O-acetylase OafA/YrhL